MAQHFLEQVELIVAYGKSFLNIPNWSSSEPCEEDKAAIITPSIATEEIVADALRFQGHIAIKVAKNLDYSLGILIPCSLLFPPYHTNSIFLLSI